MRPADGGTPVVDAELGVDVLGVGADRVQGDDELAARWRGRRGLSAGAAARRARGRSTGRPAPTRPAAGAVPPSVSGPVASPPAGVAIREQLAHEAGVRARAARARAAARSGRGRVDEDPDPAVCLGELDGVRQRLDRLVPVAGGMRGQRPGGPPARSPCRPARRPSAAASSRSRRASASCRVCDDPVAACSASRTRARVTCSYSRRYDSSSVAATRCSRAQARASARSPLRGEHARAGRVDGLHVRRVVADVHPLGLVEQLQRSRQVALGGPQAGHPDPPPVRVLRPASRPPRARRSGAGSSATPTRSLRYHATRLSPTSMSAVPRMTVDPAGVLASASSRASCEGALGVAQAAQPELHVGHRDRAAQHVRDVAGPGQRLQRGRVAGVGGRDVPGRPGRQTRTARRRPR